MVVKIGKICLFASTALAQSIKMQQIIKMQVCKNGERTELRATVEKNTKERLVSHSVYVKLRSNVPV